MSSSTAADLLDVRPTPQRRLVAERMRRRRPCPEELTATVGAGTSTQQVGCATRPDRRFAGDLWKGVLVVRLEQVLLDLMNS